MQKIKIHKVVAGPISIDDLPPEIQLTMEDFGAEVFIEVLAEGDNGEYPIPSSVLFENLDKAYRFCGYLNTHIGPIIVTSDSEFFDSDGNILDFDGVKNASKDN